MINLSYGHISKEFIDFKSIIKMMSNSIKKIDFSNYSTPGGGIDIRNAIAKEYLKSRNTDYCCTSVSTNLSMFICSELFAQKERVSLFTPTFLNYYKGFFESGRYSIQLFSYELFLTCKLDYKHLKKGDVCVLVIPNNPTGQMPSYDALRLNLEKIHKKGATVIIDASWIYSVYKKGKRFELNKLSELVLKYDSVLLLGFTKIYGVTSIRCSGVIATPEKIKKFIERHDQLTVSCGAIDEAIVTKFIKEKKPLDWLVVRNYLFSQFQKASSLLKKSGFEVTIIKPDAGIFLYFYVPGLRDAKRVAEICKDRGVLIHPSILFESKKNGFRICFGGKERELLDGISIVISVIKEELKVN